LRRSARDVPHSAVLTAAGPIWFHSTAGVFLRARSGTPYAYVFTGDANADGVVTNDLAYIPRSSADISLRNPEAYPALDAFIESEPCLREQRGRVMTRNSCRNPAVMSLDARLGKTVPMPRGQSVEITGDVFNLPHLLNHAWGVTRQTTDRETLELISVSGWDAAANRPRFSIPTLAGQAVLPPLASIVDDASRWRVQLGARYNF
jgi:hypothetical protein